MPPLHAPGGRGPTCSSSPRARIITSSVSVRVGCVPGEHLSPAAPRFVHCCSHVTITDYYAPGFLNTDGAMASRSLSFHGSVMADTSSDVQAGASSGPVSAARAGMACCDRTSLAAESAPSWTSRSALAAVVLFTRDRSNNDVHTWYWLNACHKPRRGGCRMAYVTCRTVRSNARPVSRRVGSACGRSMYLHAYLVLCHERSSEAHPLRCSLADIGSIRSHDRSQQGRNAAC